MFINDKPCNTCANYDPIKRGDGSKQGSHGWCAVKSVYPFEEPVGKVFPEGVKRAAAGEHPKPHIVTGRLVEGHCAQFRAAR